LESGVVVPRQVPDYAQRLRYAHRAGVLMAEAAAEYERVLDHHVQDTSWLQDYLLA
jgi:hypothetical protein